MSSKTTPESITKGQTGDESKRDLHPYDISKPPAASLVNKFSQVLSTPNLRCDVSGGRGRKLRRSHSAESIGLPKPSPISPLRLPSLTNNDSNGIPWSEAMHESLRLSRFPAPPRLITPTTPQNGLGSDKNLADNEAHHEHHDRNVSQVLDRAHGMTASSSRIIDIRVQQPTSTATPRPSTSVSGTLREISPSESVVQARKYHDGKDEDNSRHSVHLHSMRISHHLRSGSLLSWDQLADAPEQPSSSHEFHERNVSDTSRISHTARQLARHDRQSSSSGIASSKIPPTWGKVLRTDAANRPDFTSSLYSSRPQSPPGSLGGSMVTLPLSGTENQPFGVSSSDLRTPRRSASFPTDNEETPRPVQRHVVTTIVAATSSPAENQLSTAPVVPLARKNSVAYTKVSKFREEFSPPPSKKKLPQSSSFIKFLNPKRLSVRSQSEANLQSESPISNMDGPSDTLDVSSDRERRQSQSLLSLRAEQEALGKNKGANHVWDRALQAHQEEKASLFLPKNRDLAITASPFRERSGSVSTRRISVDNVDPSTRTDASSKRLSIPRVRTPGDEHAGSFTSISRRIALIDWEDSQLDRDISTAFEKQGDGVEVVGAWGRYPSHTRHDRTGSAGKADNVLPRDFALEAAIKFASGAGDEDLIDPTQRRPSTPLLPGEKKKKKKVGGGRIMRSNSMTFGKTLMKNYTKMFKSQSTEFRRHGRGHRSSIASGGILEHPELELLPELWAGTLNEIRDDREQHDCDELVAQDGHSGYATKGKGRLFANDSMATLRPRRNSSAPNFNELSFNDGVSESQHAHDRARDWSVYYEHCVNAYPQPSTNASIMTSVLEIDSRNASQLSHKSVASQSNDCASRSGDDCAAEQKSLVSVRRSTMDLISKFKDQEAIEHERILTLSRMDSDRAKESLAAL